MSYNNISHSSWQIPDGYRSENQEPPLPAGWHESYSHGTKYYYNDNNETTWTRPTQPTSLPSNPQPTTPSTPFLSSSGHGADANRQVMRQAQESLESRLSRETGRPELYATGAQTAQLSYLGRYAQTGRGMTELSIKDFDCYWSNMFRNGYLRVAEVYGGPVVAELTDVSMAVGSGEAVSCVIAFARTTVNISGSNRTFGACIHVDPADPGIGGITAINPLKAYELVFKPLYLSLKNHHSDIPEISRLEFFVIGASRDAEAEASLRLAAATVQSARCTEINVVGCMLPNNTKGEATSAFMTKNVVCYAKEDLSDDE